MFNRTAASGDLEEAKDIFAPVADLMVGVVFIFIVLMLALVMNLRNEETVPKSTYDTLVTRAQKLEDKLAALRIHMKELEAKNTLLTQQLADETKLRAAAEVRERNLFAANTRLVAFVRFVRENNLVKLVEGLAQASQTRSELLQELRSRLAATNIEVTINTSTGTLMLPTKELFRPGQPNPTPDGIALIRGVGRVMAQILPCYAHSAEVDARDCRRRDDTSRLSAVYIEGHTDVNPLTPTPRMNDNWDLSAARAISAFRLLRDDFEQLRNLRNREGDALIGVSGYAETRPTNRSAHDRRLPEVTETDRRIEVRVIMTTNEDFVESVRSDLNDRLELINDLIK